MKRLVRVYTIERARMLGEMSMPTTKQLWRLISSCDMRPMPQP